MTTLEQALETLQAADAAWLAAEQACDGSDASCREAYRCYLAWGAAYDAAARAGATDEQLDGIDNLGWEQFAKD